MAESDTTYSVYFTGRWLSEPAHESRIELLRRLFPHADDERLSHFLDRRRVLLIHGESLEEAERIVKTLLDHKLDCEIVEDAGTPLDVAAAMKPHPATARAATAATPTPADGRPTHHWTEVPRHEGEEEFTPRGRKILRTLIAIVVVAVVAASWAAWRRLQRGPAADVADMPSTCATDAQTTWYGRTTAQILVCTAKTSAGARYVLTFSCDRDANVRTTLAFSDPVGAPRAPAWPGSAPGSSLSIEYAVADDVLTTTPLRRGVAADQGALPAFDASLSARTLAASSLAIGGVFDNEQVRFDLEAARWYIDYFTGACGLGQPPL